MIQIKLLRCQFCRFAYDTIARPSLFTEISLIFAKYAPVDDRAIILGRVDKRDSQTRLVLIQDCFSRSCHGSWRLVGCGMGTDRAAAAA